MPYMSNTRLSTVHSLEEVKDEHFIHEQDPMMCKLGTRQPLSFASKMIYPEKMSLSLHTGILDLKIISNNAILLIVLVSTTFALPGTSRVSNEAKFFQKVKF